MLFRRFLRWLLAVDPIDDASARALKRRFDDLSDDVATLDRRFNRLQGFLTGAIRRATSPEDEDEDEDEANDEDEENIYGELLDARDRARREG